MQAQTSSHNVPSRHTANRQTLQEAHVIPMDLALSYGAAAVENRCSVVEELRLCRPTRCKSDVLGDARHNLVHVACSGLSSGAFEERGGHPAPMQGAQHGAQLSKILLRLRTAGQLGNPGI